MNWAHVHLFLNHVPVLGTVFGAALLLAGVIGKNGVLQKTGLVVLVVVALFGLPVYFTGEPAEELVEHLPGVDGHLIHEHEKAAKFAIVGLGILGIVAAGGLIAVRKTPPLLARVAGVTLALALFVSTIMFRTAGLGGQIRHTEIRGDTIFLTPGRSNHAPAPHAAGERDDD